MGNYLKYTVSFLLLVCWAASCSKWQDKEGEDLGLSNRYCNDPLAINYNHGFPGVADNSVCVFPADPFAGTYIFNDTVYLPDPDTLYPEQVMLRVVALSRQQLALEQFCPSRRLTFFADRYYRAVSDTDSLIGPGRQLMCRIADTMSGSIEFRPSDSSLYLDFSVVSDTGTSVHKGRAYKQ